METRDEKVDPRIARPLSGLSETDDNTLSSPAAAETPASCLPPPDRPYSSSSSSSSSSSAGSLGPAESGRGCASPSLAGGGVAQRRGSLPPSLRFFK